MINKEIFMFTCEDKGFSKEAAKGMYKLAAKKDKFKKSLPRSLGQRKDVKNPGALAADIGRNKYGKKKFQQMAAKGRAKTAALNQTAFNMGFYQKMAELEKSGQPTGSARTGVKPPSPPPQPQPQAQSQSQLMQEALKYFPHAQTKPYIPPQPQAQSQSQLMQEALKYFPHAQTEPYVPTIHIPSVQEAYGQYVSRGRR